MFHILPHNWYCGRDLDQLLPGPRDLPWDQPQPFSLWLCLYSWWQQWEELVYLEVTLPSCFWWDAKLAYNETSVREANCRASQSRSISINSSGDIGVAEETTLTDSYSNERPASTMLTCSCSMSRLPTALRLSLRFFSLVKYYFIVRLPLLR